MHEFEIDKVLPRYGIMVNNDAVVRTSYYKYFHPKVMVAVMVVAVMVVEATVVEDMVNQEVISLLLWARTLTK